MSERILLVDDEAALVKGLRRSLEQAGFEVEVATDGRQALERFAAGGIDLIILDLMLPEVDGLTVCREVRKTSQVPIIMLTARDEDVDRIVGLELGADDYVVKPFNPRELIARIRAVLRRVKPAGGVAAGVAVGTPVAPGRAGAPAGGPGRTAGGTGAAGAAGGAGPATGQATAGAAPGAAAPGEGEGEVLVRGPLRIDRARYRVTLQGRAVELTPREFDLLLVLAQRPGRVYTRWNRCGGTITRATPAPWTWRCAGCGSAWNPIPPIPSSSAPSGVWATILLSRRRSPAAWEVARRRPRPA